MLVLSFLSNVGGVYAESRNRKKNGTTLAEPITRAELLKWVDRLPPSLHAPDQTIFYRKHLPYGIYILHWGEVVLTRSDSGSGKGENVKAPAILGLPQILSDTPYPYTAVTAAESAISFLPKSLLLEWLQKKDPLITQHIKKQT